MKLGIGSYTYGWAVGVHGHMPPLPLDEHDLLDKAQAAGLERVQIGDNLPLHEFASSRLDRLAARAVQEGIQIEVGARGLSAKRIAEYTAIARRLDCSFVRFVIDEGEYRPNADTIIALLRQVSPTLEGITLALENHDRFPALILQSIVEAVGDERVGICLDTANSLGTGEGLERVASILAPYTVNLHVKDVAIERLPHQMGFQVTGRPAGSGLLNLPALLEQIGPLGRCHSAILEQWTPPEANLEDTLTKEAAWAALSLDYLRPLFS